MSFNIGFLCPECGPIQTAKKRSINKVQHDTCPTCLKIVTRWERPLNERSGHCGNCAGGSFSLSVVNSQLLRCCKKCGEVVNTDKNCEIVKKGDKNHEYKG